MGLISPAQSADGETIEASDINGPINTIANEVNGNIDTVNLKDAAVATAKIADSGVTTIKIADGAVTNAKLDTTAGAPGGAWKSWTPTWSGLTLGNGTVSATYSQVGKTTVIKLLITWGSTTSCSTPITFTLPTTAKQVLGSGNVIGSTKAYDVTNQWCGPLTLATTTTAVLRWFQVSGSGIKESNISSTSPNTWTTGNEFQAFGVYETA